MHNSMNAESHTNTHTKQVSMTLKRIPRTYKAVHRYARAVFWVLHTAVRNMPKTAPVQHLTLGRKHTDTHEKEKAAAQ